jgi:hypothetical protein
MKAQADLSALAPLLQFEGMLAGDPHMGNFGVLPLTAKGGSRRMHFVNIDFDDAGRGPLVLDFIRYEITVKVTDWGVKRRELRNAYFEGLEGKERRPPSGIKKLLGMKSSNYDEMASRYAARKTSNGQFVKSNKIKPYNGAIPRKAIEAAFGGETLLDVAIRIEARGGSEDKLRVWVLLEDKHGRPRIMELKEYSEPATSYYQPQPERREWLKEVRQVFWPGLDGSDYDLVNIGNAESPFWKRAKKVSLIDVPYTSGKPAKLEFLKELAAYDANQLGLAHGRQTGAKAYRKAIEKHHDGFQKAVKAIETTYIGVVTKAFEERRAIDRKTA